MIVFGRYHKENIYLSNYFTESRFIWHDYEFNNVIAAVESTRVPECPAIGFSSLTPTVAKQLADSIGHITIDYDSKEYYALLYEIMYCKFSQDELLKIKLINTNNEFLYGDVDIEDYEVGRILMRIRKQLKML